MIGSKFIWALFLLVLFEAIFAEKNCTKEDLDKINDCYVEANNGVPPLLTEIVAPTFTLTYTKDYWKPICENKQKLNQCIGNDRIRSCFTTSNLINLPFSPVETAAKVVITNFLEVDFFCSKVFTFTDADEKCLMNLTDTLPLACRSKSFACEDVREAMNCTIQNAYETCGKEIGCFQERDAALQMCYMNIYCNNCNGISIINHPAKGLCGADEDFNFYGSDNSETPPSSSSGGAAASDTTGGADTTENTSESPSNVTQTL